MVEETQNIKRDTILIRDFMNEINEFIKNINEDIEKNKEQKESAKIEIYTEISKIYEFISNENYNEKLQYLFNGLKQMGDGLSSLVGYLNNDTEQKINKIKEEFKKDTINIKDDINKLYQKNNIMENIINQKEELIIKKNNELEEMKKKLKGLNEKINQLENNNKEILKTLNEKNLSDNLKNEEENNKLNREIEKLKKDIEKKKHICDENCEGCKIHCGNLKIDLIKYINDNNKEIKEDIEEREIFMNNNINKNDTFFENIRKDITSLKLPKFSMIKELKNELEQETKKMENRIMVNFQSQNEQINKIKQTIDNIEPKVKKSDKFIETSVPFNAEQ